MRIIGHRGARGEAPENTLAGFQYLHDLGLRAVEFDVRQLPDATLVVMHDDNFIRTAGVVQDLYSCAEADLAAYNQASSWKDWPPQVTPLLNQALTLMAAFEHLEVEIKAVEHRDEAERLINSLILQLTHPEQQQNIVITSFDPQVLVAAQQLAPQIRRGLLIENPRLKHAIELALELGCHQIGWMDQLASEQAIVATHAAGMAVSVWTVNDLERALQLKALGVEGLITDFPKRMQALFA